MNCNLSIHCSNSTRTISVSAPSWPPGTHLGSEGSLFSQKQITALLRYMSDSCTRYEQNFKLIRCVQPFMLKYSLLNYLEEFMPSVFCCGKVRRDDSVISICGRASYCPKDVSTTQPSPPTAILLYHLHAWDNPFRLSPNLHRRMLPICWPFIHVYYSIAPFTSTISTKPCPFTSILIASNRERNFSRANYVQ
ncbi:hypothetical protein FRC02_007778 [Tulasnella sp. 418]|nr:hypothetical protein FRC02_007778 [Tulasnella sp. 418]